MKRFFQDEKFLIFSSPSMCCFFKIRLIKVLTLPESFNFHKKKFFFNLYLLQNSFLTDLNVAIEMLLQHSIITSI